MSHYAKVVNNIVTQVIVADEEFIQNYSQPGEEPGVWIQTSYNTRGGVHYGQDGNPDGGVALRGNYAGIGYIYDQTNDVFYPPSPFPSWQINTTTWAWEAPVPYPTDDKTYTWNEETTNWVEVTPT